MNSADPHNEPMSISIDFKEWLFLKSYIEYVESRIDRREFPPKYQEYKAMCRSMDRTHGD